MSNGKIILGCCCLVCGNVMHKVAEKRAESVWFRFYCPTCDESYWHIQDDIPSPSIKIDWREKKD